METHSTPPFGIEDIDDVRFIIKARGKHYTLLPSQKDETFREEAKILRISFLFGLLELDKHTVFTIPLEDVTREILTTYPITAEECIVPTVDLKAQAIESTNDKGKAFIDEKIKGPIVEVQILPQMVGFFYVFTSDDKVYSLPHANTKLEPAYWGNREQYKHLHG